MKKYKIKRKVGRNDLCPCNSGDKYKKCCLPKIEEMRAHKLKRGRMYPPISMGKIK